VERKRRRIRRVKRCWEIIADNLSKAGWSWGCVSAIDSEGRTLWIVAAVQRKTTAIVNVMRVIAPLHITLSLPRGEQKRHNAAPVKYWRNRDLAFN
jgi:hypothetical protein